MKHSLIWILTLVGMALTTPTLQGQSSDIPAISAEELERRSKDIGRQLRCVSCQNQSIEESPSMAAQDMRLFITEKLEAGYSDEAILDELHQNYGDYILLMPPFKPSTFLLWGLPFFLLGGAGFWFWRAVRKYSDTQ